MIQKRQKYKSINDTIQKVLLQAVDSLPYVEENLPPFSDPADAYNYLKFRTEFRSDPPGVELLQSAQTLLTERNYHGSPGLGDCDCFTITFLAVCWANGWQPLVYLAGNSRRAPSHIYPGCVYDNKIVFLDLTAATVDTERKYKFKQLLIP
jgi:hypothetical protein